jgi:prevent-host-death family protein
MIILINLIKIMEVVTASNAKREFGEILLNVQKSPISVTRNGKPIAVVISDSEYKELKLQALRSALIEGEESGDITDFSMDNIKSQLDASI